MISKELLSEVLEKSVVSYTEISKNMIRVYLHKENYFEQGYIDINIYELAHKCKEWALLNNNIKIYSLLVKDGAKVNIHKVLKLGTIDKTFRANTEPEAIFKACQYILSNKDM